ncbi:MAG: hypothetical protein IJH55_10465 [Romboutsia sp.]|nr:hypothetical protein [Romboutsia sp.]
MLINATIALLHTTNNILINDTLGANQRSVFIVYNVMNITITGTIKFFLPNIIEKVAKTTILINIMVKPV